MPKILFSSNKFRELYRFRGDLIQECCKRGYAVDLAAAGEIPEGLRKMPIQLHQLQLSSASWNPLELVSYCTKLLRLYKKEQWDLIIHFTIKPNLCGGLVCKILGLASMAIVPGLGSGILEQSLRGRFLLWLYSQALKLHSQVICLNASDARLLGLDTTQDKYAIIKGEGVDSQKFAPANHPLHPPPPAAPTKLLFAGRFLKDKGLFELIASLHQLKSLSNEAWEILLIGEYDSDNPSSLSKKQLQQAIIGLEDYLQIKPYSHKIDSHLKQAEILVLPSYREGMSRIILEAMCYELVVVATKVPGIEELVVDGKTGFLCQPAEVDSLTQALKQALETPREIRQSMGKSARARIEAEFSSHKILPQYLDYIELRRQKS